MGLLGGIVPFFFISIFFAISVSRYLMNRRRLAPINWPFLGMLPGLISNINRIHDYVASVLAEAGGNFEFQGPWLCGMNFLATSDPANTNHILNQHYGNYLKGQEFHEIFDVLGEGMLNSDGETWRNQRKMALSFMGTQKFKESVTDCSLEKADKVLIPLLRNMAERGKAFNLSDVFMRFTFDITCSLVFGVDPKSLHPDFPIIPFGKALEDAEHALLFRHVVPRVCWKVLKRLRLGPERSMAAAMDVIDAFLAQVIAEKREKINQGVTNSEQPTDLLTYYMDGRSLPTTPITSDKFLRDTVITLLSAGKETTGVALSWLLLLVSMNGHVEERILAELKEMEHLTTEGVGKLVYLHAVACETLRLYPSIPFNRKEAQQADILASGHQVKKGWRVVISMYAMGRMESVWGKDCLEFKPERWITADGNLRHEPSYKFLAFHSGPRTCLGKDTAITQMKVVAALVIYNFHIKLVHGHGHDIEPKPSIVLSMKNGMRVVLRKRIIGGARD